MEKLDKFGPCTKCGDFKKPCRCYLEKQIQCEAGCKYFMGGEVLHHKDCVHYPESLSQKYAALETRLAEHREMLILAAQRIFLEISISDEFKPENEELNMKNAEIKRAMLEGLEELSKLATQINTLPEIEPIEPEPPPVVPPSEPEPTGSMWCDELGSLASSGL